MYLDIKGVIIKNIEKRILEKNVPQIRLKNHKIIPPKREKI